MGFMLLITTIKKVDFRGIFYIMILSITIYIAGGSGAGRSQYIIAYYSAANDKLAVFV